MGKKKKTLKDIQKGEDMILLDKKAQSKLFGGKKRSKRVTNGCGSDLPQ